MVRYPHTCTLRWNDVPETINGKAVEGQAYSVTTKCRIEPTGTGTKFGTNGDNSTNGFRIYIPLLNYEFSENVSVVTSQGAIDGKLRKFQRHIVVWG